MISYPAFCPSGVFHVLMYRPPDKFLSDLCFLFRFFVASFFTVSFFLLLRFLPFRFFCCFVFYRFVFFVASFFTVSFFLLSRFLPFRFFVISFSSFRFYRLMFLLFHSHSDFVFCQTPRVFSEFFILCDELQPLPHYGNRIGTPCNGTDMR